MKKIVGKMSFILFFLAYSCLTVSSVAATPQCGKYLIGQTVPQHLVAQVTPTDKLIAYISQLHKSNSIGNRQLLTMAKALETGSPITLISEHFVKIDIPSQTHRDQLDQYLNDPSLDLTLLSRWLNQQLHQSAKDDRDRQKTNLDISRTPVFHAVYPESFGMLRGSNLMPVRLTHPYEMMSTPVTQQHWFDIMGDYPSHFQPKEGKGKMYPNRPVESVTFWSALVFANKLSIKNGLEPAYDLSELKFKKGTSAARGTLEVVSGELHFNAPNENFYLTLGYRLPTNAEFEYLLRHQNIKGQELEYVWFDANSSGETHDVGTRKAITHEGLPFYDLYGNVREFVQDASSAFTPLGDDPFTRESPFAFESARASPTRGGGYKAEKDWIGPAFHHTQSWERGDDDLGFRLVRTLP